MVSFSLLNVLSYHYRADPALYLNLYGMLFPGDPAARQQSLERYRDKKARRFNNSTKVRYEMRKVNADKRPRIKGRFVKPEELQSYLESMPASLS